MVSPLHKVIDAGRWDAEPPLGRLVIVVHAAFLDAGFVPHGAKVPKSGRLPKQVGRTASTLSLRYTAPQLLHRRDAHPAMMWLRADGRHGPRIVFYVCIRFVDPRPDALYFMSMDALAAAPLLSRGLDETGRALRNDALVAALWKELTEGMSRRLLVKVCRMYGVPLEPTFMSLPDEVKVAIVGRLTDGEDLARVERTCTELRRLVADHDDVLWKPRFEALTQGASSDDDGDDNDGAGAGETEVRSWKARYMRAKRRARSWRDLFSSSWWSSRSASSFFFPDDDDAAADDDDDAAADDDYDDDDDDGAADDDDDDDDDGAGAPSDDDDDDNGAGAGETEVTSWKARYSSWRDRFSFSSSWIRDYFSSSSSWIKLLDGDHYVTPLSDWLLPSPGQTADAVPGHGRFFCSLNRLFEPVHYVTTTPMLIMPPSDWLLPSHGQTADAVPGRMRIREKKRGTSMPGHGRSRTAASDGYRKKQHGAGAIHSPSSRYRWKHR